MQKEENKELEIAVDADVHVASSSSPSIVATIGSLLFELIKILLLSGITIVFVRYFLFKPFYVRGESMEPTYFAREYLIIDELTYRLREPMRGEVVVFHAPDKQDDFYIKRVIGLPGERIKIASNKVILFNEEHPQGVVLDEGEYLVEDTSGVVNIELGEEEYFVMGDNRDASFDSRRFGAIHRSSIVGRSWLRGWPFTRLGVVETPMYNL